jgi:tetraprenyl-beta-curcumene synthase
VQPADGASLASRALRRVELATAFLTAAQCYWLNVFPHVQRELDYWRRRAGEIPDPELRHLALEAHCSKWCNVEGAAAFATLAPSLYRRATIRVLVTFQAAYDYADTLAEQTQDDPVANGRLFHQSLLVALDSTAKHPDYYAHSRLNDDGGYLRALADNCRRAFGELPARVMVAPAVRRATERIVTYQSLNHSGGRTQDVLACWAEEETLPRTGLRWWETSAACASSLTALALLSAAANPALDARDVLAIESAYHPWVGALHTLLDSLIDWNEDEVDRQTSLLDCYNSIVELAETMRTLARRSREAVTSLPQASRHAVLLAGMTGLYLSDPEARSPRARLASNHVLGALGDDLMRPALLVMRTRRVVRRPSASLY